MDAQILDADCVQVGKGPHAAAWIADLRSNAVTFDSTSDATEIGRRDRQKGYAYVVRLWCRTSRGESICVLVADPWSTSYRRLKSVGGLENLARAVQDEMNTKAQNVGGLVDVSIVYRKSTNGFVLDPETGQPVRHPWLRTRVVSAFLKSQQTAALIAAQKRCFTEAVYIPLTDAEARVEVHLELLQTMGLYPGGWLHLASSVWDRAASGGNKTHTAFHIQVMRDELSASSAETDRQLSAIRVLSWDLECYSAEHAFPIATNAKDAIITIGLCSRTIHATTPEAAREERVVYSLLDVTVPDDSRFIVRTFATEAELLTAFAIFLQESDADVLVGYNTCGFDWKYVKERIETLQGPGTATSDRLDGTQADAATRFSRVARKSCQPEEQQLASSAMGDNPLCYPRTPGRLGLDLWLYLKRENSPQLPNLKLNTVASHYLGDTKVDLPPKAMFAQFETGPEGRFIVADYCCQDCMLVLNLVEKLNVLPTVLEMSKVTSTIPEDILYRGQQIKVYAQLLAAAHETDEYVVEDPASQGGSSSNLADDEQEKYKGAHVEEPKQGYYLDPILTVDFASLYPSLMRTYNLSPDTLLPRECETSIPHASIQISPDRAPLRFVAASHCRGLLPKILDTLLQERKRVKKAMAKEECPFRRQLLDAKQLALKISANSVYGACGAIKGMLQCREVAEATTATGRDIIAYTKETIENHFEVKGCQVIYGDTDSAFVRLPETHRSVSEEIIFQLGKDMAKRVTDGFKQTLDVSLQTHCVVELEMEKYLKPLILYKKKRYVGIAYEEVGKKGKILAKGIELVRRDSVPLVRSSQAQVIEALLQRQSPVQAVASVKEAVRAVQAIPPGGPFTQIVLSKSLRQNYAQPDSMPHVKVAALMNERDPGSAPRIGDRVEYVVVASESSRVVDRVEDVGYASRQNLPPDWYFYVEALERPLLRILEVPLADTAPELQQDLQNFFAVEKAAALQRRRLHSHARQGAHWVEGLACKKGSGLPQRKLAFFGFASAPASASQCSVQAPASELPSSSSTSPDCALDIQPAPPFNHRDAKKGSRPQPNETLVGGEAVDSRTFARAKVRPKGELQGAHGKRACTALLDGDERQHKMRQTTL